MPLVQKKGYVSVNQTGPPKVIALNLISRSATLTASHVTVPASTTDSTASTTLAVTTLVVAYAMTNMGLKTAHFTRDPATTVAFIPAVDQATPIALPVACLLLKTSTAVVSAKKAGQDTNVKPGMGNATQSVMDVQAQRQMSVLSAWKMRIE